MEEVVGNATGEDASGAGAGTALNAGAGAGCMYVTRAGAGAGRDSLSSPLPPQQSSANISRGN